MALTGDATSLSTLELATLRVIEDIRGASQAQKVAINSGEHGGNVCAQACQVP